MANSTVLFKTQKRNGKQSFIFCKKIVPDFFCVSAQRIDLDNHSNSEMLVIFDLVTAEQLEQLKACKNFTEAKKMLISFQDDWKKSKQLALDEMEVSQELSEVLGKQLAEIEQESPISTPNYVGVDVSPLLQHPNYTKPVSRGIQLSYDDFCIIRNSLLFSTNSLLALNNSSVNQIITDYLSILDFLDCYFSEYDPFPTTAHHPNWVGWES